MACCRIRVNPVCSLPSLLADVSCFNSFRDRPCVSRRPFVGTKAKALTSAPRSRSVACSAPPSPPRARHVLSLQRNGNDGSFGMPSANRGTRFVQEGGSCPSYLLGGLSRPSARRGVCLQARSAGRSPGYRALVVLADPAPRISFHHIDTAAAVVGVPTWRWRSNVRSPTCRCIKQA